MMSITCRNLDFGRMGFDLVASCSLSNASSDRFAAKSSENGVKRSFRKAFHSDNAKHRVYSTKTSESLANGVSQGPLPVLEVNKESSSSPISLARLFELVADDVETLNKNLQNIVGAENPLLMSAAEQIFGAGGKRLRPALVFLVSRATSPLAGLQELTTEHWRLAEIIEMIHTASLIHDDVIDGSDLRRDVVFCC